MPFGLPVPREEFVQPELRLLGDAGEDVGEPGLRVDVVELGGADERVHHSGPRAATIGAGKQPRFPRHSGLSARSEALLVRQMRP